MNQGKNILLILTDQERDAGAYESPGMHRFRNSQLPARARLFREGLRFEQHRISTSACVPSRVSLFTGYPVSEHGVHQTDGFAKLHDDPALNWLPPNRLPTLGHRFQAHGWETLYFGKWHLSYANLHGEDGRVLGPDAVKAYEEAQPLKPYGFSGWTGPEPHGADVQNAGVYRDESYVAQAQTWLRRRSSFAGQKNFLLVVSLVNPHDIVFWPPWSLWQSGLLDLGSIDDIGEARSEGHLRAVEPSVLEAYRERYPSAYGPASIVQWLYDRNPERYRKFYCSLLRRSDRLLGELLNCLDETGLRPSTHVVFSSDHGELLGAHGGLHQKWYNAYEETLRVPLVISTTDRARAGERVTECSDHLDIVPTLLALGGVSEDLPESEAAKFERTPALPGRDLLRSKDSKPTYFVTHDHIMEGESRKAAFGRRFPWVGAVWPMRYRPLDARNTSVEAVVDDVSDATGQTSRWKLIRYFDPATPEHRSSDEWSLFCLSEDPCEIDERVDHPDCEPILAQLREQLLEFGHRP